MVGSSITVSLNATGTDTGNGDSVAPFISRNGRWIIYIARATDLTTIPDDNEAEDVILFDNQAAQVQVLPQESIPTLSKLGMVLLVLLMLNVVYVGFRSKKAPAQGRQ